MEAVPNFTNSLFYCLGVFTTYAVFSSRLFFNDKHVIVYDFTISSIKEVSTQTETWYQEPTPFVDIDLTEEPPKIEDCDSIVSNYSHISIDDDRYKLLLDKIK